MSAKKVLKFQKEEVVELKNNSDVFNFATFKKNMNIKVVINKPQLLELQINGVDSSITNALRRIIIAQIPTMAFHKVFLYQNTSVLPDELLVHRLGLLPVNVDSSQFQYRKEQHDFLSENSLKFQLKVICKKKKQYSHLSDDELQKKGIQPEQYLQNANIYSKDIKWVPLGSQATKLKNVKVIYDNILIAKLRQNQQINLQMYAEKGIGKKHAKWSPVSTCFYRLMPEITLQQNFNHQKNAQILVNCCPMNIFKLKKNKAVIENSRNCTTCRQCINVEGVELGKIKDNYIFTIESIGVYKSQDIFLRALDILEEKSKTYLL